MPKGSWHMPKIYYLIMAGGEGVRFRPLSTPDKPKQFLCLTGSKSMIRQTFERLKLSNDGYQNVYVATNIRYVELVRKELPEIPFENIIGETEKKNTAPAIAFAAHLMLAKDQNAVMTVFPSDHVILKQDEFKKVLEEGINISRDGALITLGIKPTRPATCYGYIEAGSSYSGHSFKVSRFVEKPPEHIAKKYIESGNFFWNSGIFIWRAKSLLEEISYYMPDLAGAIFHLPRCPDTADLVNFFERAPNISIDYAVMEKSKKALIIPCDIGWSDVGTWESLKELSDGRKVEIGEDVRKVMECELA